jgi:3-hydroxyacyl-[acyl-carrier-protein] dehydratase
MRWIWIDRVEEFRSREYARAIKNVTLAEEHLHDHFPGYPIMPTSLILEGLAQTGGLLVGEASNFQGLVVLAKISRVVFHDYALPGDQLTYEVFLRELRPEGAVASGTAKVGQRLIAEAEIVFAQMGPERAAAIVGNRYSNFREEMLDMLRMFQPRS